MRVLFTVPPLAGHVNPTVAVGAELAARGHEIAWTGPASALARLLPAQARILPAGEQPGAGGYAALHESWRDLRGVGALRFLWEEALVPLARAMVPGWPGPCAPSGRMCWSPTSRPWPGRWWPGGSGSRG